MKSLAGKIAVVTGASRGVGQGIALSLGEAGAAVYITGRTTEQGKTDENLSGTIYQTADEVTRSGGKGIPLPCDHRNDPEVETAFSRVQNPIRDKHKGGRWFFEVYPHPAQVVLFNLPKIIRYKKGRVAEKRQGLDTLRSCIKKKFVAGNPPIRRNEKFEALLEQDLEALKGKPLKHYEDTLDALVCAYLAMYYWTWGDEKNEMIGDLETGYIINPTEAL